MQLKADERFLPDHGGDKRVLRQHVARYEFASAYVKGNRVVDVACGAGYGAAMLKKAGATSVRGFDISSEAVAYAQSHYASPGVEFSIGQGENLPLDAPVDVITSFETIEHVPDSEKFLASLCRGINEKGMLIISTPVRTRGTLETPPANPFHVREWNSDEFEALLRGFFSGVSMYGQYELMKWPFPGSRTLQNGILRVVHPSSYNIMRSYDVMSTPPRIPPFSTTIAYIVAVCKH